MQDISLIDRVKNRLHEGNIQLPVFDAVALEVHQAIREGDADAASLEAMINQDSTLTSQVLTMANSAFFAGLSKIGTVRDAVVRLGQKQIGNLAISVGQQRLYSHAPESFRDLLHKLWLHSMVVAMGCKWLAIKTGHKAMAEEAFTAGLLHDIGKVVLLSVLDDILDHDEKEMLTDSLVQDLLRQVHTEIGATALRQWNLPEAYVDIAENHHQEPPEDIANTLALLVRLVNKAEANEGLCELKHEDMDLNGTIEARELSVTEIQMAELLVNLEDFASKAKSLSA